MEPWAEHACPHTAPHMGSVPKGSPGPSPSRVTGQACRPERRSSPAGAGTPGLRGSPCSHGGMGRRQGGDGERNQCALSVGAPSTALWGCRAAGQERGCRRGGLKSPESENRAPGEKGGMPGALRAHLPGYLACPESQPRKDKVSGCPKREGCPSGGTRGEWVPM